jgi:hypothetical protein
MALREGQAAGASVAVGHVTVAVRA